MLGGIVVRLYDETPLHRDNFVKLVKKVYNEDINPIEQIDQAIAKAKSEGKFVICQVGGNWCYNIVSNFSTA